MFPADHWLDINSGKVPNLMKPDQLKHTSCIMSTWLVLTLAVMPVKNRKLTKCQPTGIILNLTDMKWILVTFRIIAD